MDCSHFAGAITSRVEQSRTEQSMFKQFFFFFLWAKLLLFGNCNNCPEARYMGAFNGSHFAGPFWTKNNIFTKWIYTYIYLYTVVVTHVWTIFLQWHHIRNTQSSTSKLKAFYLVIQQQQVSFLFFFSTTYFCQIRLPILFNVSTYTDIHIPQIWQDGTIHHSSSFRKTISVECTVCKAYNLQKRTIRKKVIHVLCLCTDVGEIEIKTWNWKRTFNA